MSGFEDVGLAVQADAAAVLRCPTCIALRFAIEALIGTEDEPRQEVPEFVVAPLLIRWQQHKDASHPALSAYLRRTTP